MKKEQIKRAISKNLKVAETKGKAIKKDALKKYATVKADAIEKGGELEKIAMKELEKVKKQLNVTADKAENYIKKNPAKAAAIAAGIGAALAAAATLLLSSSDKKVNKKKK